MDHPHVPRLSRETSKKLLNEPTDAVWQMIDGLVQMNAGLNRIEGHNVIVRADIARVRDEHVAIVSGGGSGHEPSHGGWVGPGMLSAAVAGDIFASPPSASVFAAIMAVTGAPGCLVIIKNYTGDRLNFGLAVTQARAAGLSVEMVVVGDDCALPTSEHATVRRRGLAGTVIVHKVAGAAAAAGFSLSEVAEEARATAAAMGTVGLSLTSCSMPGQSVAQRIPAGQVEIGLGIHGEPGASTRELAQVDTLVDSLLEGVLNGAEGYRFLSLERGEPVCLLLNNLGSTTLMELTIAARHAIAQLEDKWGARVVRVFTGTFMSALDMQGISLTVVKLDKLRLARLDALTRASAWPSSSGLRLPNRLPIPAQHLGQPTHWGKGRQVDGRRLERMLRCACARVRASHAQLNEWDRIVGDGDCGDTLDCGARATLAALDALDDAEREAVLSDASAALRLIAAACQRMGGSSGALYNIALTAAGAEASLQVADRSEAAMWAAALHAACNSIAEFGGARPGLRTMLDALVPADEALTSAVAHEASATEYLDRALAAATAGAEATKALRAYAGRSAYVPEAAQRGIPDPGAMGVVEWMRGLREGLD